LIRGLNVKLIGMQAKIKEKHLEARKYALQHDMERARTELHIYQFKCEQYTRLLGIYNRANIIRDTVDQTHTMSAVATSLQQQSNTVRKSIVPPEDIERLMDEWNDIMTNVYESQQALGVASERPNHDDEELERLIREPVDLSLDMPSVPTNVVHTEEKEETQKLIRVKEAAL
jgi:alpha-L-arabinofuranosidase